MARGGSGVAPEPPRFFGLYGPDTIRILHLFNFFVPHPGVRQRQRVSQRQRQSLRPKVMCTPGCSVYARMWCVRPNVVCMPGVLSCGGFIWGARQTEGKAPLLAARPTKRLSRRVLKFFSVFNLGGLAKQMPSANWVLSLTFVHGWWLWAIRAVQSTAPLYEQKARAEPSDTNRSAMGRAGQSLAHCQAHSLPKRIRENYADSKKALFQKRGGTPSGAGRRAKLVPWLSSLIVNMYIFMYTQVSEGQWNEGYGVSIVPSQHQKRGQSSRKAEGDFV